jgi:U3 small nucleolar RNA-associated protein 25
MVTLTEVKLLTLLNVTAIKRPRDLDQPGGQRSSPSTSWRVSPQPILSPSGAADGGPNGGALDVSEGEGEGRAKRRKSVVFGGEVGPSGSTYGKNGKGGKGKGKGKADEELNDEQPGSANGHVSGAAQGSSVDVDGLGALEEAEGSDEEQSAGGMTCFLAYSQFRAHWVIGSTDIWNVHFGAEPSLLTPEAVSSAEAHEWRSERRSIPGYGRGVENRPAKASTSDDVDGKARVGPRPSMAHVRKLIFRADDPFTPCVLESAISACTRFRGVGAIGHVQGFQRALTRW